jgi:hypothetical protein
VPGIENFLFVKNEIFNSWHRLFIGGGELKGVFHVQQNKAAG